MAVNGVSYNWCPAGFLHMTMSTDAHTEFEDFMRRNEARLRTALVLTYGPDLGREATAEALVWAWEHWATVAALEAPVPYLYRVGQSRTRRIRRRHPDAGFAEVGSGREPWVEPALPAALDGLTTAQRVCTLLIHAYDWTHAEVAELLGATRSTVQSHAERGMAKLRSALEVEIGG
jgi:DNA-directed RNA polymerase specialized sigma24 family protein